MSADAKDESVSCNDCGNTVNDADVICRRCSSDAEESAYDRGHDAAVGEYDAAVSAVSEAVRDWLDKERCKPGVTLSAELVDAFERCIEDLR